MTSKSLKLAAVAVLASGLMVGVPAMAQSHGLGGYGGGHGGNWGWGVLGLGLGLALAAPYYPYYGSSYYPPAYYPPNQPPLVIQEPVYIDPSSPRYTSQAPPPPPPPQYAPQASASEGSGWWYYCDKPHGYYPYVEKCPGGWQKVSPIPQ